MEILKYSVISLLSISAICIIIYALKSGKPIRNLLFNSLLGIFAIAVIDLTTRFTGVHIPVNQFTAIGSAAFGIPAVCGILFLQIIFK